MLLQQRALQSATTVLRWIPTLVDACVQMDGTVSTARVNSIIHSFIR